MKYIVKRGDYLIKISREVLGDEKAWSHIAFHNHIKPPYTIYVGQELRIPQWVAKNSKYPAPFNVDSGGPAEVRPSAQASKEAELVPARAFFFVLADEVLPSGKVVRKVLQFPTNMQEMVLSKPEVFGIKPPNPNAKISIGEHALGSNQSPYVSASTLKNGAPNFAGRPVYIDVAKAKKAGVIIHSTEDIIEDLNRLQKAHPNIKPRVDQLKSAILNVEKEVLLQGDVPASAVKSGTSVKVTTGLRAVQFVGFALTAYDLGKATHKSIEKESPKPIVAEGIRQVGGWGGAVAGMKVGGATGALLGIKTGPGAIITGGIGAMVFGVAGYFGADWVADFIDEN